MTRSVECVHQPTRDRNHTRALRDQDCQNPKPSPVQACNRFDCPPTWEAQDWVQVREGGRARPVTGTRTPAEPVLVDPPQCSRSCGGGVQTRRVLCKQKMADGSVLELPDTFCPSQSPPTQQACSPRPCPPTWVTAAWTQVGPDLRPQVVHLLDVSDFDSVCLSVRSPVEAESRSCRPPVRTRGQRSTLRTVPGPSGPPEPGPAPSHPAKVRLENVLA